MTKTIRITTWNINSVRLRMPLVQKLVRETAPDVLCLQEIKCENGAFPTKAFIEMGYNHQHVHGMKSYNGVAILSRLPLIDNQVYHRVQREDRRHISTRLKASGIELHNIYLPAGSEIPDPLVSEKFQHKLDFIDELGEWGAGLKNDTRILMGDLNIAPGEHDVWSHKQMLGVVSHTQIEIDKFYAAQRAHNWLDVGRHFVPETEKLYSWWSYRNQDWKKSDRGRRLDHIWATPDLKSALQSISHDRDVRDWQHETPERSIGPSDHVPVTVEIKV
jgi:exodeoxyribonuclease III